MGRKIVSIIILIVIAICVFYLENSDNSEADNEESINGSCGDNTSYALDILTGTLTISGDGEMASYSSDSPAPWYDHKNDVKKLIVGDNITGIGAYAFYDCISIESVTIGDSVASIGKFAFGYCKSLESVTMPDSVVSICNSAFTYCDSLESVTIGDSVSSIEDYAFFNCSAILSFNVPSSVKDIGTGAFSGIGTFKYSDGGSELETTVDYFSGHTWERNSKSDSFLSYETLSYDGNGSSGGSTASQSVENGGSLIISDNGFTTVGYRFTGWNTQANGGGEGIAYAPGTKIDNVTSDFVLYAQWAVDTYTVTFDGNGSTSGTTASVSVTYDADPVNLTSNGFIRTGYTFTGWNTLENGSGTAYSDGASISNLTADLLLYAQWSANTYTVTFDGNGSTSGTTASVSVTYDAGSVALTANGFSKTGYSFAGWNTQADGEGTAYADGQEVSNLTSSLTLYAQWTADTYVVSFDGNGSTSGTTDSVSVTYDAGPVQLTSNGFSRTGYTFSGWNTQADGTGTSYSDGDSVSNLLSDLTLYAQWAADTYTVTFDGNGSTSGSTSSTNVTYGASPVALTLNGFTRTGYTFSGWNTQADGQGTAYADGQEVSDLTSSFALYAQWTANTYDVTFEGNGSTSGTTASMQVTYGADPVVLTPNGFSRTGYTFASWNTQADGGGAVFADEVLVSDLTESIILYAQWTADIYTVTFDGNGSTSGSTASVSVTYDAGPVALTTNGFTRTGYTFTGWNTQDDGEGTNYADGALVSNLLSDLTLYAQWTANTYTVTFDGNGSTSGATSATNVTYGADPVALNLNNFEKIGYSFVGWNTQADGEGTAYADGQEVSNLTSSFTLYAQWTANTYEVAFVGNGSTSGTTASMQVTYGEAAKALILNGFSRIGYSFAGWNTQADGEGAVFVDGALVSDLTEPIILYAQWTANTYTVTFDGNGSTSGTMDPVSVTYGAGAVTLTSNSFSKTGYTFSGWNTQADGQGTTYSDGDSVSDLTSAITLYAQWTIITYTISYDGNGADGGSTDAQTVEYGGTLAVLPNGFTKTGYSFAEWNTQADGEGTSYAAGDEIADMTYILTLYAQWTADTYAVTFDGNGSISGSIPSVSVTYGAGEVTLPANGFTKTGYTFTGWNTQANGGGVSYTDGSSVSNLLSDLTLYAQWTANTYTVSFDGNGSTSGTTASVSVTYDAGSVALTANGFSKTGYSFAGWNTQADGEGTAYAAGASVSNLTSSLTLYAQWTADTYVVSFDGNGSTSGTTTSVSVTYDAGDVFLTSNGFTRTGYSFAGWNTQVDGEGTAYAAGASVSNLLSDLVLYAQWTINIYTLTYDGDGADGGSTDAQTVEYGGTLTVSPNGFTKTGYTFNGWNIQADGEGTSYAAGDEIADIASDLTLYAIWAANTYTVSFDGNGSTAGSTASVSVTYGAGPVSLTANGFTRDGFVFIGWNDSDGNTYDDGASISDITSDLTLYAMWTAKIHTVTFDGNGSTSGTTASMQVTYGEAAKALTANGFVRDDYSFAGWNTAADGSGTSYADGAEISDPTADLVLYAQWEKDDGAGAGIALLALATAILIVLFVAGAVAAVHYNVIRP